jgi:hypothetical protein
MKRMTSAIRRLITAIALLVTAFAVAEDRKASALTHV